MFISKKNLRRLIETYLIESDQNEMTFNFGNASIKAIKKDNKIFISSWPSAAKIKGYDVSNVSITNLMPIEKIENAYQSVYSSIMDEIKNNDTKNKEIAGKKYAYEEGVGYPIILYNTKDPIISKLFIDYMPDSAKQSVLDSIPEGHVGLICIDPRSRKAFDINFGVWSAEDGGNEECQNKNKTFFEDIINSIGKATGVYATGSLTIENSSIEANLIKKNKVYEFKDEDAIKSILKSLRKPDSYEYVVINDCKYINKTIAYAKTNKCSKYSLVPKSIAGDLAASLRDLIDTATGDSTTSGSSGSDNCASMGYKLAYLAKNGSFPKTIDQKLFQFPPHAIKLAKETLE